MTANYSAVYELFLPTDKKGNYVYRKRIRPYGPEKPVWNIWPDTFLFGAVLFPVHNE